MNDSFVKYDDVAKDYDSLYERLNNLLENIDAHFRDAREKDDIPIYFVKGRVKKLKSAFLKIKRKNKKSIFDLTDLLGMRVFCLYEEDIEEVHKYLLKYLLNSPSFTLEEINIYASWNKDKVSKFLEQLEQSMHERYGNCPPTKPQDDTSYKCAYLKDGKLSGIFFRKPKKQTGYKSIHYVFDTGHGDSKKVRCEIQLRTIFQDIWAEIEHDISYKKSKVHRVARELFENLSDLLEASERQVSIIKKIQSRDILWQTYSRKDYKFLYFYYDHEMNIDSFMKINGVYKDFVKYQDKISGLYYDKVSKNDFQELSGILEKINNSISDDSIGKYFIDMETALLILKEDGNNLESKTKQVEAIYSKYTDSGLLDRYVVYARMAEICYLEGEVVDAFINFDECERIMNSTTPNVWNKFNIYMRFSYICWSFGYEYLDEALDKVNKAKIIYNENNKEIRNLDRNNHSFYTLHNNICFYTLEKIILLLDRPLNEDDDRIFELYDTAKQSFSFLKERIDKDINNEANSGIIANWCDTVAWHNYQIAKNYDRLRSIVKEDGTQEYFLDEAKKYCEYLMNNNLNISSMDKPRSSSYHKEHIQEIMTSHHKFLTKNSYG